MGDAQMFCAISHVIFILFNRGKKVFCYDLRHNLYTINQKFDI